MARRVRYDFNKPGIPQVYKMGKSYEPWSYTPLPGFTSDCSIVIIGGPLEALTHVPKWMPACWLVVAIGLFGYTWWTSGLFLALFGFVAGGPILWPLIEYALHRWVFHIPTTSGNGILNVLHFLLHGIHHKTPHDTTRLLAPLPMVLFLSTAIYMAMRLVISSEMSVALWIGIFVGYVQYDYTHLYLHTPGKKPAWIRHLAKRHQGHHSHQHNRFYGISYLSNLVWDAIFRTQ